MGREQGIDRVRRLASSGLLPLAITLAVVSNYFVYATLESVNWDWRRTYAADFLVMWRGAREPLSTLYTDMAGLPFAYPPTTLLLLKPLALLPFELAILAFVAVSLAAAWWAFRRDVGARPFVAAMLAPAGLVTLLSGQLGLFIAALMMAALTAESPARRGALFAVAACIKPQLLVAVPIALLASRDYRALGAALVTGTAGGLLSMVLFGPGLWLTWLGSIDDFYAVFHGLGLASHGAGLAGFAARYGLPPGIYALGVPLALASVWVTFRYLEDARLRLVSLACGAVLVSPYLVFYDLVGAALVASWILFKRPGMLLLSVPAAILFSGLEEALAVVWFAVALPLLALRGRPVRQAPEAPSTRGEALPEAMLPPTGSPARL